MLILALLCPIPACTSSKDLPSDPSLPPATEQIQVIKQAIPSVHAMTCHTHLSGLKLQNTSDRAIRVRAVDVWIGRPYRVEIDLLVGPGKETHVDLTETRPDGGRAAINLQGCSKYDDGGESKVVEAEYVNP